MRSVSALPGSAKTLLPQGVAFIDPAEQVFALMLAGWQTQQPSRALRAETYKSRINIVRRFQSFLNKYPWDWQPADFEAFSASLRSRLSFSSFRGYQNAVNLFQDYVTDQRYGWAEECMKRFGASPIQICDEWNTSQHTSDYEGRPERRPLTFDEIQTLFDHLDDRVERNYLRKRKGSLAALRDGVMIKMAYAWGLRRREVCSLQLADIRTNPHVKEFGRFGAIHVRYGKGVKGSPPRRRIVLTVPQFDWAIDTLEHYLKNIRPQFQPGSHPGIFVTERCDFVSPQYVDMRFHEIVRAEAVSDDIDLHHLRHSYATHLAGFGYDPMFIQQQLGHTYAATTALYTHVSSNFKNKQIREALKNLYGGENK